jgi:hypothetical protein
VSIFETSLVAALVYVVVVATHEYSHYIVGRWRCRVPVREITVVLLAFTHRVALRDGDEWVPPTNRRRYQRLFEHHGTESEAAGVNLYTAGGPFGQTVGVVTLVGGLAAVGRLSLATFLLSLSAVHAGWNLLLDGWSLFRGDEQTADDFSGLWQQSRPGAAAVVCVVVVSHAVPHALL